MPALTEFETTVAPIVAALEAGSNGQGNGPHYFHPGQHPAGQGGNGAGSGGNGGGSCGHKGEEEVLPT